jgi:hypothetical protein
LWANLGTGLLEPLIDTWRFVRRIERDLIKGDDDLTPPACTATEGRFPQKRRCRLPAFHPDVHEYR